MKRFLSLLLMLCVSLSGCSLFGERLKEPVTFYYLRSEYANFTSDGVIVSEEREASGHREDLAYLMALYFMGPSEEDLRSPLPKTTRIYSVEQTEDAVVLTLSDTSSEMSDMDFSLACACLSMTCLELTDAQTVTVTSGERSITMNHDTLVLYDGSSAANLEETK